ncbi:MAG: UDP-glucose 4-epimerase GalE, partial [Candidatus Delongbacteria bacterium]|nr:UDP-glucose 4-epimerase GalE [Candidatus Delongbacteria bacterium]
GLGYIGSHTSVELIENVYDVVIIDNLSNSNSWVLDGIKKITGTKPLFYEFNLQEKVAVKSCFQEHPDIEAVIHFAAYKAVGESHEKPLAYYQNNIISLMNLLDLLPLVKNKQVVFSSSCTVYGNPDHLPVDESAPFKPALSPYGNTKRIAEEILMDVCRADNSYACISLRYFNPIGAHPSAYIGEQPQGIPNNLMPFITQTAFGIRKTLKIFGTDYNTHDGTCIRDYINVVDLARAHVIAVERMLNQKQESNYEYFNLGTGKGISVLDMVKSFERVSENTLNYAFAERRPGDVPVVYADTTKANKILGWKAHASLDETIRSAWKWEKKQRNL